MKNSCYNCESPDCHGCNIYLLWKMLKAGKLDMIKNGNNTIIPFVDVVPVRHGRWAQTGYDHGLKVCECSVCKKRAYGSTKFCSNCGALMDKDGDGG